MGCKVENPNHTNRDIIIKIWLTFLYLIFLIASGLIMVGLSKVSALSLSDSDMFEINGDDIDDTMLMFVGEELDVVTVASRTPESPSTAPAVVSVVDHNDIVNYGYKTLAEVLSSIPGFYISDQGMGSLPYLRGISNGILILYDGVPVPTGGPRSYYPLDHELSLNSVKRIEVIRGPGSVLWGADAFAGIVNIVPFTGKDVTSKPVSVKYSQKKYSQKDYLVSGKAEVSAGSKRTLKGFADAGCKGKNWDAYLSAYGGQNQYDNGIPVNVIFSEKDGKSIVGNNETIENSQYREFTANFNFKDSFSLSGRYSDFNKYDAQTLSDAVSFGWLSEKKVPANHIKANYSTILGGSHWNMTAYYQDVSYDQMYAKQTSIEEDFSIFYGEILWDHRFFKRGLITAGISYRENDVQSGWGFMPEYLLSGSYFKQPIKEVDYKNSLKSLFSQYRHPFNWGEIWAGFRFDDNSMYEDYAPSYSVGVNIPLTDKWRVKTAFGTGYRTPYSQQWTGKEILTRDEVSTLNLQAEWISNQGDTLSATGYVSRLSDNVQTDPYAGVSAPSDQDFSGVELFYKKKFADKLDIYTSISKIFYSGDNYNFSVIEKSILRPDGSHVDTYHNWTEEYELGADFIANSGFLWHFNSKVDFNLNAFWTTPIKYTYKENTITGEYDNPVLVNGEIRFKDIPYDDFMISVGCKNILDGEFTYPSFYGAVNGDPLTGYAVIRYSF
ncbi:MAG: TonB-dependent receptor plug domain-containing protein [Desulfamplus sp.]|nr:TonB-dependent receptor plug domain-containing protein [Desulfamplus sp.]